MIRYCIRVDMLNFPIYVIHILPVEKIYTEFANSKIKQQKADLKVKHYHMQHK